MLSINSKIKIFGRVAVIIQIAFIGERYYWLKFKDNTIGMYPAEVIERLCRVVK